MAKKYNIYEERVSEGETSKRPGSSGLRQSASVDFPRITEKTETVRRAFLFDEEVSREDVVRDIVDSLVDKVSRKVRVNSLTFVEIISQIEQIFSLLTICLPRLLALNQLLQNDIDRFSRLNPLGRYIEHPSTNGRTFTFVFCLICYWPLKPTCLRGKGIYAVNVDGVNV